MKVGQQVLDIGNPYSRSEGVVTFGSITGLNKTVTAYDSNNESESLLREVIQINNQLYPGDSGGPLFDLEGKVIGINVAAAKNSGNMGFSIPIEKAHEMLVEAIR